APGNLIGQESLHFGRSDITNERVVTRQLAETKSDMALLVRIYLNAVFGALGGLLGWLLFGTFGEKGASDAGQWLLGGALIGGSIGYLVVSVDAVRDRSLLRFCRLAAYGVVLGALGGAVGMCLSELVNDVLLRALGYHRVDSAGYLVASVCIRAVGW